MNEKGWEEAGEAEGGKRKKQEKQFTRVSACPWADSPRSCDGLTFNLTPESQWETVSVRDYLGQAGHRAYLWRTVEMELGKPA